MNMKKKKSEFSVTLVGIHYSRRRREGESRVDFVVANGSCYASYVALNVPYTARCDEMKQREKYMYERKKSSDD